MELSEKRFEYDIEAFLISKEGGYEQFVGQDHNAPAGTSVWLHNRQHDVKKCIYMSVLIEFIEKTQPAVWKKYKKYYGDNASEKLYHRLENVINEEGLIHVLRNGIEDLGCKFRLCYFRPESNLNEAAMEKYNANILGCTRQFRFSPDNDKSIDMVLSLNC